MSSLAKRAFVELPIGHPVSVGFVGLGHQGAPIAARLALGGYPLTVWARRPETLLTLARTLVAAHAPSATAVDTLRELGRANDVVFICVGDDDDCEEVVGGARTGILSGALPGSVLVIHSTVSPNTVVKLAERAAERGVALVDAPVSGSRTRAEQGTMTVIVGGEPAVIERLRALFETYAALIANVGPVGTPQLVKLLNNTLNYANMAMAACALDLAVELGLDESQVAEVLAASSGNSRGLAVITDCELLPKTLQPGAGATKIVSHFATELRGRGIEHSALLAVAGTAYDLLSARAARVLHPG